MKQIKFLVEEFHRGKWSPLMVEKKGKTEQRRVFITQEQADAMNVHQNDYKERYIKADEVVNVKEIEVVAEEVVADSPTNENIQDYRAQYKNLYGKGAFNGWDIEKLKEKIAEKQK